MTTKNNLDSAAAPRYECRETKRISSAVAVERCFAGGVGEAMADGFLAVEEAGAVQGRRLKRVADAEAGVGGIERYGRIR